MSIYIQILEEQTEVEYIPEIDVKAFIAGARYIFKKTLNFKYSKAYTTSSDSWSAIVDFSTDDAASKQDAWKIVPLILDFINESTFQSALDHHFLTVDEAWRKACFLLCDEYYT